MNRFKGQEGTGQPVTGAAAAACSASLKAIEIRVRKLVALAHWLERIEAGVTPVGADHYLALVRNLTQALSQDLPQRTVAALLNAHPAAAELYENLHYATAGLSRATPARAIASQAQAVKCLARLGYSTRA